MARPAVITVPDKPGIVDFMRHLVLEWEAKKGGPGTTAWVRTERIGILKVILALLDNGRMLPLSIYTTALLHAYERALKNEGAEDRDEADLMFFDQACTELEEMLRHYRPTPSTATTTR